MGQTHATTPADRTREDAAELGDDLVQLLTVAKIALEVGDPERAISSLDAALAIARQAMTDLSEAVLAVEGNQTMLGFALRSRPTPGPAPTSRRRA